MNINTTLDDATDVVLLNARLSRMNQLLLKTKRPPITLETLIAQHVQVLITSEKQFQASLLPGILKALPPAMQATIAQAITDAASVSAPLAAASKKA